MKIGIFHNLGPGGAKRALFEMTRELAKLNHDLVEIAPSSADVNWCSLEPYIQKRKVFPFSWPLWEKRVPFLTPYLSLATSIKGRRDYFLLTKEMNAWLEEQSLDLLFANDCMFFSNPPLAGITCIPNILYIHHGSYLAGEAVDFHRRNTHSFIGNLKEIFFWPASYGWVHIRHQTERWAGRRAGSIACNSKLAQAKIRNAYGRESQVIHYGVDARKFQPDGITIKDNYVLSAGNINPHKSFDFLIKSLASLPKSIRPRLLVAALHVDSEELTYLERLATEEDVEFEVLNPGSDMELIQVYNQAMVFVFAARFEPFGMVALEAMACGKPVVGVEDGGYTDCIVDGETGYITPRSPEAFGQALAKLMEDPRLRSQMGTAARLSVEQYWTWERCAGELNRLFLSTSMAMKQHA